MWIFSAYGQLDSRVDFRARSVRAMTLVPHDSHGTISPQASPIPLSDRKTSMSDKFFFKGRQNARLDHKDSGYTAKGRLKSGSEKYPLQLTVGSEQRREAVAALVAEHELFADIHISEEGDDQEDIAELIALVNRTGTVTISKTPSRNEPCSCGSGKKFKKCCG